MPARGWDWTALQERVLNAQRERERKRLSAEEIERLYQEEIATLREENAALRMRLAEQHAELSKVGSDTQGPDFGAIVGREIYAGEVMDRVRFAAGVCLSEADRNGIDSRTRVVLERLRACVPVSDALRELRQDIERACKDTTRSAEAVTRLLCRHGYMEKGDNKHVRLEAARGFEGLEPVTLAKTPSDYRAMKNLRTQIERALGLTKLD
ncbi:MAG: hypothetical protein N2483_09130 [Burkholderiaceae bacterium]|nr:hypothetical protein [Burkholderiaceae bacterium]